MKKLNRKGFTIIELVIVIAVIAILAAVMVPTFSSIVEKANKSAAQQEAAAYFKEVYALDLSDGTLNSKEGDTVMKYTAATTEPTVEAKNYIVDDIKVYEDDTNKGLDSSAPTKEYILYKVSGTGSNTTFSFTFVTSKEYKATTSDGKTWIVVDKNGK